MAKDPAFLFYPGDFMTGTQFFTDEQVGKYIRLLMAQHQHGHLTEEHMLFICKSYDKHIFSKFIQDPEGNWYNERLEFEVNKRKNYSLSRAKNREKKVKENNISVTYDLHMENENIVFGIKNNKRVVVKKKYVGDKNQIIYSLKDYFDSKGQLQSLIESKWTKFDEFMNENPGKVFDDENHLYNSFKQFSIRGSNGSANPKTQNRYKIQ